MPEVEFKFKIISAKFPLTVPDPEMRAVALLERLFDIEMEEGELQDEKKYGAVGPATRDILDPEVYQAVPEGLTAPPFCGEASNVTRY